MSAKPALPRQAADWHRRVWSLAAPIILSNLSVPLVGAVDTAVVGHLPDPVYIGAVALGALIFSFLFWGFGFLRMGTTGFVAQAVGAGDPTEVRSILMRALLLAAVFGIVLLAMQRPVGTLAFWLLEGGEALETLADGYYRVRIWSAPAALANYAVLGCLIGLQNTRAALVQQLVLNLTNVALDLLFVLVLEWGVAGVAVASVISEYLALAVGLGLARADLLRLGGRWDPRGVARGPKLRALLSVNFNIFVRTLCLVFAFAFFTAQGTKLGETVLAANAVLLHLQHILAYGLDGFAHAVEALAGAAYGAGKRAAFRSAVFYTTLWAFALSAAYTAVYVLFGAGVIGLLTGIDSVRETAMVYLPWMLVSPIVSVWSFQLDGIFIGTTRTVEMRNAMLLSLAAYLATVWIAMPAWGNHGLWLSLIVFMIFRAVTLGFLLPSIGRGISGARA